MTVAASLLLAGWLVWSLLGGMTRRSLIRLDAVPEVRALPSLTVVVPCRNEERDVERAMRSLLAQQLPALRIVAVDDRSTDGTGELLDRLAATDPRLEVLHVTELPPGWLGKNHACAAAARRATSDWLLFTDADVRFAPDALPSAIAAAVGHGLGHLAGLPRLSAPGFAERAFVSAFASLLAPAMRVWELRRPGTAAYVGIGAFNLVRRDAYEAAGGHARLPLEVIDDMKLGLLLRRGGVAQGAADVSTHVEVRWQNGFLASALGLVKNGFAALEYRLWAALGAATVGLLLGAGPLVLAVFGPTPLVRAVALAALTVSVLHQAAYVRRFSGGRGAEGLLMPVCLLLLSAVVVGSAGSALLRGGVIWRGTRYPLAALRANCLREAELPLEEVVGWPAA
jgi:hypothetical protein